MNQLSRNVYCAKAFEPVAAGTTAVNSVEFDTEGYDGIMGFAVVTPATSAAAFGIVAYSAASTTATFIAIDGSSATSVGAVTGSYTRVIASDVYKPVDRIVRFQVTRSGSNSVLEGGHVLMYGAMKTPVTWSTSTTSIARTISASSS